jgi:signal transduction histidine kinase
MSLEKRLLAGIALTLLLALGGLLWLGGLGIRQITEGYVLTRLQHDSEALLAQLNFATDGRLQPPATPFSPVYRQPLSGHYFMVRDGARVLRSRSLWDEALPLITLAPGETRAAQLAGPGQQRLLSFSAGYRKQGHELTLLLAEDMTPLDTRISHYRWLLGGSFALLAGLLLLAVRLMLRRGFRRLDALQADMHEVATGGRARLGEQVPDEVRPLVQGFNRLLGLLGQRLERSRNALGNLAHALKTPLSLIVQELDQPRPGEEQRRAVLAQVGRIRELVDRELRRARIAGAGSPGQRFDARSEVPALLETLRRLYRERHLQLEHAPLPDQPLAADREDMLELLGNLLDNACKWTASAVHLGLETADDGIAISVEDDGPGVDDTERIALTERGSRLDESREGHGLGLAIVRDIVDLYDGELRFDRSPRLGGLRVRVRLQVAP